MAQNDELNERLREGIAAARRGDRNTGRNLLQQVIDADPDNELAWIWLASCLTDPAARREALQRVLQINPDNARAQQALQRLGSASGGVSADTIDRLRQTARDEAAAAPQARRAGSGGGNSLLIGGLLIGGALIAALLIVTQLPALLEGDNTPPTATPAPLRVMAPTSAARIVTPTLPPPPTATLPPYEGTSLAPTLPPPFTATPLPSDTPPPPPSPTPYPQAEFVLYYTSLAEGQSAPNLYRISGEGGEAELVARDVRDPAIGLSQGGPQIAFVRDVTIEDAETGESTTFPELFVAPLDNLDAARQITEIRSTVLASPSWSPEGLEIIFVSDFDGDEDIWYVTPDGENLRKLTENDGIDREPDWRPVIGSRQFVLASDRDSFGSTEIYLATITEPGVEMPMERITDNVNSSSAPRWNSNGSRIAFISDRQGDPDVYIMDANGRGQRSLIRDDNDAEDRSPQFSPDGTFIAFVSNRQDDRFQVYLVSEAGDVLVRLNETNRDAIDLAYLPVLLFRVQP